MICVVGGVEASQAHYYSYRNVCIHNNKRPNDIDDDNRPYVVRHSTQYWRERSKKNYTRTHRHTYTCTQSTCAVCPEKIVFSLHSCDYGIQTLLLWCCWCWQSWLTTTTANSNFDDDVAKFSVHTHSRVVWIPYGHNTLLFTFYIILVGLFFFIFFFFIYSSPFSLLLTPILRDTLSHMCTYLILIHFFFFFRTGFLPLVLALRCQTNGFFVIFWFLWLFLYRIHSRAFGELTYICLFFSFSRHRLRRGSVRTILYTILNFKA